MREKIDAVIEKMDVLLEKSNQGEHPTPLIKDLKTFIEEVGHVYSLLDALFSTLPDNPQSRDWEEVNLQFDGWGHDDDVIPELRKLGKSPLFIKYYNRLYYGV